MSNFVGMDVAAVHRLSLDLKAAADRLNQVTAEVERIVHLTTGQWEGHDANDFRQWWSGQHRPNILAAVSAIGGLGQSAANNADEQVHASGGGAAGAAAVVVGAGVVAAPAAAAASHVGSATGSVGAAGSGSVTGARDWREVQGKYDAWATGRFAAGGESYYQCVAWANYRWHELGYSGPAISGNGWQMAANAGPTTHQPSLHAMASYGTGSSSDPYGHVMIVEEVRADGAIRVSEMNATWDNHQSYAANIEGHPDEYRDNRWITRNADGNYHSSKGQIINFTSFRAS
jgi:surface antigen